MAVSVPLLECEPSHAKSRKSVWWGVALGLSITSVVLFVGAQHYRHEQQMQHLHKVVEELQHGSLQKEVLFKSDVEPTTGTWPNGGTSAYEDLSIVAAHLKTLDNKLQTLQSIRAPDNQNLTDLTDKVNALEDKTDLLWHGLFGDNVTQPPTTARPIATTFTTTTMQMPYGVQLDLDKSVLSGWTEFYRKPYSHSTTFEELESIPESATWVAVAAQNPGGDIKVCAFGKRGDVLQETPPNDPHLANGVWWYLTQHKSFGFSGKSDIDQNNCDMRNGGRRLCWHLSGGGGYRAGRNTDLNDDSSWTKLLYFV